MATPDTQPVHLLLQEIEREQAGFHFEKEALENDVTQHSSVLKRLSIKLLLILGGLLGSSTFLSFFMVAGLYESGIGLFVLGLAFLIGGELLVRYKNDSATDAIGVSLNITAYLLLAMGAGQLTEDGTAVAGILACTALLVIIFSRSAICVFIGVLVLSQSLVALLVINKVYYLAHGVVILLAGALTYMSLSEAKLITVSPSLNLKYNPIRMGVLFSLVMALTLFVHQKFLSTKIDSFWISSSFLFLCLAVLIFHVLQHVPDLNRKTRVAMYCCCALLLVPTFFTPSIPGALLILLSSFYIGHRTGFWTGLLALAYFVVMYYYDLNMTLLVKSIILMASGVLFLGGFVLFNRYLKSYAD